MRSNSRDEHEISKSHGPVEQRRLRRFGTLADDSLLGLFLGHCGNRCGSGNRGGGGSGSASFQETASVGSTHVNFPFYPFRPVRYWCFSAVQRASPYSPSATVPDSFPFSSLPEN